MGKNKKYKAQDDTIGPDFPFLQQREAGVLLHVTSLPGGHGIGDLGMRAYQFVDWMVQSGLRYWQILPLVPPGAGYSPYSSWSAMASNISLIDLDALEAEGLIESACLVNAPLNTDCVDFEKATAFKESVLKRAYANFIEARRAASSLAPAKSARVKLLTESFESFKKSNEWLSGAALYCVLRQARKSGWVSWPEEDRKPDAKRLAALHAAHADAVEEQSFYQFIFDWQWNQLHAYAKAQGVQLIGDLPIYVDHDSADVWLNQSQFDLGKDGQPLQVSGVPPDNFSATGQLWGHPIYNWKRQEQDGYPWWKKRLKRCLEQTDIVRIDHFRGFAAYWSVPFGAVDAVKGKWVEGPGFSFFKAMQDEFGQNLPVIAEDLGYIDAPVRKLKAAAGLPGMCVLEFGFADNEDLVHHPDHHPAFSVCYTGTHDNETAVQWRSHLTEVNKKRLSEKFDHEKLGDRQFAWKFIELAFSSESRLCVIPMQDFLALGESARMNFPSTSENNWAWRVLEKSLSMELAAEIRSRLMEFERWNLN